MEDQCLCLLPTIPSPLLPLLLLLLLPLLLLLLLRLYQEEMSQQVALL